MTLITSMPTDARLIRTSDAQQVPPAGRFDVPNGGVSSQVFGAR